MRTSLRAGARAILFISALAFSGTAGRAAPDAASSLLLKNLKWRSIGPALMGGRIDDFAVVEKDPRIIYVGTAAGGIFKSTNAGTTWEAVFDSQVTSSIGDVTVSQKDPNVVWAGTGEANNRQSSSWGNGVYRSTDAGKTWQHAGLEGTMHIGRIVLHPENPDAAYVAAGGRLWGPSKERGVYKTTDGGKTWSQSLFVDENTGCTDIVIDPQNPNTLYAAMYQRQRTAFGFHGSGPGSGIYKTTDGGGSWKKLTNGLPAGDKGRIGLDIYRKNPSIVYAIVEAIGGGVFRTEDGGETWQKMSATNPRPMYYSQIAIDPSNDQRVWVLGVPIFYSEDGGKNFRQININKIHSDFHAVWINPNDSDHLWFGCDGGMQVTHDRAKTWDYVNTIPLAQFYEVAYDMRKPYWVYGGLQDNGSWMGPSQTLTALGPSNDEWVRIGGGDGFYAAVDPTDANTVYSESQNGALTRRNMATGEGKSIRPRPETGEPNYRFDWNSPILISPHNPKKLYFGGNRLFISEDRGDTWRRTIDLTTSPDRSKQKIMGQDPVRGRVMSLDDGQSSFGQILTVSESPLRAGVVYVGTDDGNLQVSHDDGRTWKNVAERVPGVPRGTYVSRVQASNLVEGRVYCAFDGHRSDDFKPYIFVSEDFGESWRPITNGIPAGSTLSVIREHPKNGDLLFAGTERGAYVSFDRGQNWEIFGAPLPMVPIDDIQIHPRDNDLIFATHGRGVWILDDLTPFQQYAETQSSGAFTLFNPHPAVAYRLYQHKGSTGDKVFLGQNPGNGATIQYFIKSKLDDKTPLKIAILEKDGKTVVREYTQASRDVGVNRQLWDLRYGTPGQALSGRGGGRQGGFRGGRETGAPASAGPQAPAGPPAPDETPATRNPTPPGAPQTAGPGGRGPGGGQGGGPGGFGGFFRGPRVMPGTYLVKVTLGTEEQTKPLVVEEDPRLTLSPAERKAHFNTVMRLFSMQKSQNEARQSLTSVRSQLTALKDSPGYKQADTKAKEALAAVEKRVEELNLRLSPPARRQSAMVEMAERSPESEPTEERPQPEPPAVKGVIGQRAALLMNSVESITEVPSRGLQEEINTLSRDLKQFIAELNALSQKELPALAARFQPANTASSSLPPKVEARW